MIRAGFLLIVPTFLAGPATTRGGDTTDLAQLLSQPIIGPALPMAEVQAYTESRVPVMPELESAAEWEAEAVRLRREMFDKIIFRGEAARWREAPSQTRKSRP